MSTETQEPKTINIGPENWRACRHMIAALIQSGSHEGLKQLDNICQLADRYVHMLEQNHKLQQALHPGIEMNQEQAEALFHLKADWKGNVKVPSNDYDGKTVMAWCGTDGRPRPYVIGICTDGTTHS